MYKGTLFFLATDTSLYLLCNKRCNWQFFLQILYSVDSYILLITEWFSLQTLTAEIGNVLELKDVDKGIDDYRSTPHLTFDQYRYYLSKEVNISFFIPFSSNYIIPWLKNKTYYNRGIFLVLKVFSALPEEMSVPDQHVAEAKLDDVFWSVCKSHYIERDNPIFPVDCVYKLFRVFSMLGEMVENDDGQIEVNFETYKTFVPFFTSYII